MTRDRRHRPSPPSSPAARRVLERRWASCAIPSRRPRRPRGPATRPGGDPPGCPTAQPAALPAGRDPHRHDRDDQGDIEIKVEADLSPIAAGNFVALADCGWYDGVVFHRVVPGFVIQGGDGQFGRVPNVTRSLVGTGGPPYTIKDEPVTTTYHRGTVAMARTAAPDTVGSQFFIVLDDEAATALATRQHLPDRRRGHLGHGGRRHDRRAPADQENPTNPIVMTKVTVANP